MDAELSSAWSAALDFALHSALDSCNNPARFGRALANFAPAMFRQRTARPLFGLVLRVLLGVLAASPDSLQAQNPSKSAPDTLIHAPWLREVLVAGTRNRKSTVSLPLPATVISQEQIRRSATLRLSDLLQEQSGLILQQGFGTGVQIQGLGPEYNLILLDGEPLIGRSAGTLELQRLGLNRVRRVEIVKGPSSALYGSEALGGVVNLVTDDAEDSTNTWSASQRVGSLNTLDLALQGQGKLHPQHQIFWDGGVNFFQTDQYSLRPFTQSPLLSPLKRFSQQQKMRWSPHPDHRILTQWRSNHDQSESLLSAVTNGQRVETRGSEENGEHNFRIDWVHQPTRNLQNYKGRLRLYGSRFDKTQSLKNNNGPLYSDGFQQAYLKAEWQGIWTSSPRSEWVYGMGTVRDAVRSERYGGPSSERVNPVWYVFQQWDHRLSDRASMLAAVRFDRYQLFGSAWSPKVALQWWQNPQVNWKASVARGFKTPDFRQLYLNFINPAAGNYRVLGSLNAQAVIAALDSAGLLSSLTPEYSLLQALRPEYSTSLQLGRTRYGRTQKIDWRWEIHGFAHLLQNMIDSRPVAIQTDGSQIFSYLNINQAYTTGIENKLTLEHPRWSATLGWQMLWTGRPEDWRRIRNKEVYTRDDEGFSRLMQASDYRGLPFRSNQQVQLGWTRNFRGGYYARWQSTYRSSWLTADTDGNGLFNRQDLRASGFAVHRLVGGGPVSWNKAGVLLQVQIGVENILNYRDAFFVPNLNPRSLFIQIEWRPSA
jgi:outer membrane receptor for ferrienterochelin and colicins